MNPDDICFYRDGYCWLATGFEGHLQEIYSDDNNEIEMLEKMGVVLCDGELVDSSEVFFIDRLGQKPTSEEIDNHKRNFCVVGGLSFDT